MLPKISSFVISSLTVLVIVFVMTDAAASVNTTTTAETKEVKKPEKVQEKNAARANKKSFTFETESDYGEYGVDNYSSGYASNYQDYTGGTGSGVEYNDGYGQGTRGGRDYYQPTATSGKIQFPPNDASESLSAIHQANNHVQLPVVQDSNRGSRGLYPFGGFKQDASTGLGGSDYGTHNFDTNDFTLDDAATGPAEHHGGDPYSISNFPSQSQSFEQIAQQQQIFAAQQQAQHEAAQYEKQQEKLRKEREHLQKIQQQLSGFNNNQQQQGYFGQQSGGFGQQAGGYPSLPPPPQAQTIRQPQFTAAQSPFGAPHAQQLFSGSPAPPHGPINEYAGPYSPEYLESQGIFLVEKYPNGPPRSGFPPKQFTGSQSAQSPNIYKQYPGVFVSPTPQRPTAPPSTGFGFENFFNTQSGGGFNEQPEQGNYLGPFAQQQRPQRPSVLTGENPNSFGGQSFFATPATSGFGSSGQSPYGQRFGENNPYAGQFGNGFNQQYGGHFPYRVGQPQLPDPQQVGLLGGLASAFGFNRRGPNPAAHENLGNRISRAIEGITKNDDLQCVPKVVCQMIGSRMRSRPLPSFIDTSSLGGLVQAIPVEAPAAIYVKAALLGVTNGEYRCNNAYPRCPRDNDDVLYYLNNHRGGFFRFFSGEDNTLDDQQHHNQHHQQHQQQGGSSGTGLLDLLSQFGLDGIGQGGGGGSASNQLNLIALQNIAAALNPSSTNQVSQSAPQSTGIGGSGISLSQIGSGISMLSNLANLFGGQGRSRDVGIESNATTNETKSTGRALTPTDKEEESLKGVDFKEVFARMAMVFKKEAIKEAELKKVERKEDKVTTDKSRRRRSIDNSTTKQPGGVSNDLEPRIVNQYVGTITEIDNGFKIPSNNRYTQSSSSFNNPSASSYNPSTTHSLVSFAQQSSQRPLYQSRPQPQPQRPVRVENLPTKTGTGKLSYDNSALLINIYQQQLGDKHDEVLELMQQLQEKQQEAQRLEELNRLQKFYTHTYRLYQPQSNYQRPSYSSSSNYQSTYQRPSYSSSTYTSSYPNRYTSGTYSGSSGSSSGHNKVYVTNSRGQTEYYIDQTTGKKHYL